MSSRFLTRQHAGRSRRHRRVRARVIGTAVRPRLSVFRSAKHISAQLIDDAAGRTLVAVSDRDVASNQVDRDGGTAKVALATAVGKLLAERARVSGVSAVVFDRAGYAYHGRVRAIAEGARSGGLEF